MKTFFRVGSLETNQGLWYNMDGEFTGLIHDKFNFCQNKNLQMPFDENMVGYLSTVDKLEDLFTWFSKSDILKLYPYGYRIMEYLANDYKFYNGHWLINRDSSKFIKIIEL